MIDRHRTVRKVFARFIYKGTTREWRTLTIPLFQIITIRRNRQGDVAAKQIIPTGYNAGMRRRMPILLVALAAAISPAQQKPPLQVPT
jgi:hypothetical protein